MLDPLVTAAIARVVAKGENALLRAISEDRVRQEPDMTSRLVQAIEIEAEQVDDVRIQLTVVDGIGPGASERSIGADVVGVVRFAIDDMRVTKGFLAQSKRAGQQGVHMEVQTEPTDLSDPDTYSHWLYRGALHLLPSGTVTVTKPSPDLVEQCENMLRTTPASFVFVFHDRQVGVVSASAVRALQVKPAHSHTHSPLGTKRLDDFFIHLADSFIGDRNLAAADSESIRALALANRARAAVLLTATNLQ